MEQRIQLLTRQTPPPAGLYSQGVETEQFVFVSEQRSVDLVAGEMKNGIKSQTEQVIKSVECVLREAGCTLADIVRSTIYLSDISCLDGINEVCRTVMPESFPTRSTFGVQLRGILVEIDVIAEKIEN